jgi:hypothetical protein
MWNRRGIPSGRGERVRTVSRGAGVRALDARAYLGASIDVRAIDEVVENAPSRPSDNNPEPQCAALLDRHEPRAERIGRSVPDAFTVY